MAEHTKDGGSAFPQHDLSGYGMGPSEAGNGGMTLRDYFAGQAVSDLIRLTQNRDGRWDEIAAASMAFGVADALLAAREVKP